MSDTDALAQLPTLAEHLPDDVATLKGMVVELIVSLQQRDRDNAALRHRVDLLLRRLYGPRTERCHPDQPLLFDLAATDQDAAVVTPPLAPPVAAQPKRRCRPHGRRRLPTNLPREPRHHELPEAARLCPGCGQVRVDIGVDRSEQLEYRPASLLVIEHCVHKYVCRHCRQPSAPHDQAPQQPRQEAEPMAEQQPQGEATPAAAARLPTQCPQAVAPPQGPTQTAPQEPPALPPVTPPAQGAAVVISAVKPTSPIAKGLPGPGLLAHLIVSKYVDHLPLYRLERIYERQGLFLPRSTLCDWLAASADLLRPLYERLIAVVLQSRALHTDDTTVKLQDPASHQLSTARLWIYLGDAAHPYNVFDFTTTRQRDGPQQFLLSYQGYLHADAFSGYDGLYLPQRPTGAARIIEVACNAHARRKFYEARSSDTLRSHQALAYYRQLYELERSARANNFTDSQKLALRQDLSLLILGRFHDWLTEQQPDVLPKSPLGQAFTYALNNWTALVRYTEAGFLDIDNNVAEREMKRIAIGRKNWLFVGSVAGGQTAALLFSFTSTCQRLGVEPWAYLQDVLTRLPELPAGELDNLLPDRWPASRATAAGNTTAAASTDPTSGPASETTP